jgi:hypothetical protein
VTSLHHDRNHKPLHYATVTVLTYLDEGSADHGMNLHVDPSFTVGNLKEALIKRGVSPEGIRLMMETPTLRQTGAFGFRVYFEARRTRSWICGRSQIWAPAGGVAARRQS